MSTSNPNQFSSQGGSKGSNMPAQAGSQFEHLKDTAKEGAEKAAEKASDLASKAGHMAQQAASAVSERSKEVMHQAGERADTAAAGLGTQMASAADQIRSRLPDNGMWKDAGEKVASAMETSGHYLEDHKLSGTMEDLTQLVRKYPLQSLAIGVGLGFFFARIFTSSSDRA